MDTYREKKTQGPKRGFRALLPFAVLDKTGKQVHVSHQLVLDENAKTEVWATFCNYP